MVAYSFKKQFAEPILEGRKTQTVRAIRTGKVRHVRVGQEIQIYTGMRTKQCRKIGDAVCESAVNVEILFYHGGIIREIVPEDSMSYAGPDLLGLFARLDGFSDIREMSRFWLKEHGGDILNWNGVLIRWKNFVPA